MIGIGIVILLHILLIYALVTGLATSAIDIIKKPLQVVIIAPPPAPPPPPTPPPPPPQLVLPPVPYIPPPLIQVQQPPPPPVFAVTTSVKPPPAPVRAVPQPAAPSTNVNVVCPNVGSIAGQLQDSFGEIADSDGIDTAHVTVGVLLDASGAVTSAHIISSDAPPVNALALRGARDLNCKPQGQPVEVLVPFEFTSN